MRFRYQTIEFSDVDLHVRTLRDVQEFQDDRGEAAALGISSAVWPLFGVVWGSGRALATLMSDYAVDERRVLEVGCGIGLASLMLNARSLDITATDYHPEAGRFLAANVQLNGGAPIPFVRTGWDDGDDTDDGLGAFDLIIGSDVLYEDGHVEALSRFIDRHARPTCEVLIVDPGRRQQGRFNRAMTALGYVCERTALDDGTPTDAPFRGHLLRYTREVLV